MAKVPDTQAEEPRSFGERLRWIGPKFQARGWRWAVARLLEELSIPTSAPARALRAVNAGLYGGVLRAVMWPLRWATQRSRNVTLFYDLAVSPITFDFCFALVAAEILRLRRKLDGIDVVIVPGRVDGLRREDDDYEVAVDAASRRWRIDNILLPLCSLLPSVASVTVCGDRHQASMIRLLLAGAHYPAGYWPLFPLAHHPRDVLDAARAGAVVRPLRAPEQALRYVRQWLGENVGEGRVVAITLRDYHFMPERNSNRVAWTEFAARIHAQGFQPVFVPDTEAAMAGIPAEFQGFPVFTPACWNMALRMALTEAVWLNMMVNNGPFGLAAFSDAPLLMFKILTPSVRMTTEAYMISLGYGIGETPPMANSFQKWVWEDDELPVIEREFAFMRGLLEAASVGGC